MWELFTSTFVDALFYKILTGEVEKIVQRYKQQKSEGGPVFCLLMNETQFLLIAAYLKLENVNDIILIHSSPINRESTLFNLVRRHLDWRKVGMLHTFNSATQDCIFRESLVSPQSDAKTAAASVLTSPKMEPMKISGWISFSLI